MRKPVILYVDEESVRAKDLYDALRRQFSDSNQIEVVHSTLEALNRLQALRESHVDIPVMLSKHLSGVIEENYLIEAHKQSPETLFILLAEPMERNRLSDLLSRVSLFRYFSEPVESARLCQIVEDALHVRPAKSLTTENQKLRKEIANLKHANQNLKDSRLQILKINQIVREVSSTLDLAEVSQKFIENAVKLIRRDGSGSIVLYNESHNTFVFYASFGMDPKFVKPFEIKINAESLHSYSVFTSKKSKVFDYEELRSWQTEETLKWHFGKTYYQQLVVPMVAHKQVIGLVNISNYSKDSRFTDGDLYTLENLTKNLASHFENSQLYDHVMELNRVYERFVPQDFVKILDKNSILEVELGDQVEKNMSILFSDIRSFTSLSEMMTPAENFLFINSYLSKMGPLVRKHNGFIDKYIGDSIMALFENNAEDAVHAAIDMLKLLSRYNAGRRRAGYQPIEVGIGINTGTTMLGTLGDQERMEGTVISDAVNLASRLEGMTKLYGVSLLVGEDTFYQLAHPSEFLFRFIDRVKAKGRKESISVFEIYNGDPPELRNHKESTKTLMEKGLTLYHMKKFQEAEAYFQKCVDPEVEDNVIQLYLQRCRHYQSIELNDDWDGSVPMGSPM